MIKKLLLGSTAMVRVRAFRAWGELFIQGFMSTKEARNPGVLRWLVANFRDGYATTYYIEDAKTSVGVVTLPGFKPARLYVHGIGPLLLGDHARAH